MVLTQPVAQFGFDRAEVDLLVLEQRPDPAGPHGGLAEQPAVALVFVDGEDLFGDPVDYPELSSTIRRAAATTGDTSRPCRASSSRHHCRTRSWPTR